MKKGISIWSFGAAPLKESFALAKKAGFEGVEVALESEGELNLSSSEREIAAVKRMAEDSGIALYSVACGLYWDYPLTSDDAKTREKAKDIVKKQLETAAVLGCDGILVIPGTVCADFIDPSKVTDYETAYERSLAALTELKSVAEREKVHIGLENVWNKFLTSPLEMRDFIDKIGSGYVGSYLDIGNVLFNGFPEHWIKILKHRINGARRRGIRRLGNGGNDSEL